MKSRLGRPEDVSAYQQAAQDLAAATSARQQTLDAVFHAGTTALAEGQKTILSRLRANQAASWSAPLGPRVVSRTNRTGCTSKQALANERIAPQYGEDPDPDDQQFLATCSSSTITWSAGNLIDTTYDPTSCGSSTTDTDEDLDGSDLWYYTAYDERWRRSPPSAPATRAQEEFLLQQAGDEEWVW
ncbi:MAG: hypothetical protein U1E76_21715 [Planctomycetota bacterium]